MKITALILFVVAMATGCVSAAQISDGGTAGGSGGGAAGGSGGGTGGGTAGGSGGGTGGGTAGGSGGGTGGGAAASTQLSALTASQGTLNPAFSAATTTYTVTVPTLATAVTVTPTTLDAAATVQINGAAVVSGAASQSIPLANGLANVTIVVSHPAAPSTRYGLLFVAQVGVPVQQAYLKASTNGADGYGEAMAISGDTLVVGAPREASAATGINGNQADNSAPISGAVYVFVRSGGAWAQQAYLKGSNAQAGDFFGGSVAISGDTLIVGAPTEASAATGVNGNESDNSAIKSGAAYVFVRTGSTWTQQAYLKASNTQAGDRFGQQVALSGDTAAISAIFEASAATGINGNQADNAASKSGAVYVFVRSGGTWSQQAYVKASNTQADDDFGWSIALSADTLAVAADFEASSATGINGDQTNNASPHSGAVYVFFRNGTTWAQQAYLKASNTQAEDFFGYSLALSRDTLAVTANEEDSAATGIDGDQTSNAASNSGAVYVFVRTGTTWAQQAYLKASNTGAGDGFGQSIALSVDTLVVGAAAESSVATGINGNQTDNAASSSGAGYLFERVGTTWTQRAYVKASNTEAADAFGYCVGVWGNTLAIAAPGEDSSTTGVNGNQANNASPESGAVYVLGL
jgi:hypothetical protein